MNIINERSGLIVYIVKVKLLSMGLYILNGFDFR